MAWMSRTDPRFTHAQEPSRLAHRESNRVMRDVGGSRLTPNGLNHLDNFRFAALAWVSKVR